MISFLLALLLVGCTASPLAYPHFWDYTKAKPKDIDMVGTYKFLKSSGQFGHWHGYQGNRNITITLHADHTASLSAMPHFESDENDELKVVCAFSGPAVWSLDDYGDPDGGEWHVMIETKEHVDSRIGLEFNRAHPDRGGLETHVVTLRCYPHKLLTFSRCRWAVFLFIGINR